MDPLRKKECSLFAGWLAWLALGEPSFPDHSHGERLVDHSKEATMSIVFIDLVHGSFWFRIDVKWFLLMSINVRAVYVHFLKCMRVSGFYECSMSSFTLMRSVISNYSVYLLIGFYELEGAPLEVWWSYGLLSMSIGS